MTGYYFKYEKKILFLTFLFILFLVLFICFRASKPKMIINKVNNQQDIENVISNRNFKKLISNVYFDGVPLVYDSNTNVYYYSLSDELDLYSKKITFDSIGKVNYIIDCTDFTNKVKSNQIFNLFVYDFDSYESINIVFTFLPIINIRVDSDIGSSYVSSSFDIYDPDYNINNSEFYNSYNSEVKVRGSLSSVYRKKSYKLTIDDKESLFGMDKNNEWILDSLYSDFSKIRNDLSSSLWNDIISSESNVEIKNDLNCKYVEVFINGTYNGLYSFKEHIDKDTINLQNKFLIKGNGYFLMTFDLLYENNSSSYIDFEFKYPHSLEGYSGFWFPTLIMIKDFYSSNNHNDYIINSKFYIENYIDYNLLRVFTKAVDNSFTKNIYLEYDYVNNKLIIIPWDLDQTFGQIWDGFNTDTYMKYEYEKYDEIYYEIFDIFAPYYNRHLKSKYWQLRKNVFTMNTINSYLDSYEEMLVNSGAASRDSERWYEYDIDFEIEQIREWTKSRIEFLDKYFN